MSAPEESLSFPLAPLMVTAGGLVVEFGVVTAAAGILTRLGSSPAPDIGVPVFVLFVIGAAITIVGASAFAMRWTIVHRALAVALGLAIGAIALITAVLIQVVLGWILAIVGAVLAIYGGMFMPEEDAAAFAARRAGG